MNKKTINDLDLNNKKILLRVDFNVPIQNGVITSDKRIEAAIPTISKLLKSNTKIILFSHLGRIKSDEDKKKNSLEIVALNLSKKINKEVIFVDATRGAKLEQAIAKMNNGEILLFQNTRYEDFQDGKQTNYESKNDASLGKY
jgi:phosphoglycerate kinase